LFLLLLLVAFVPYFTSNTTA